MSTTQSPNMNLIIPTAGNEPGPTYALDVNASLSLIDEHDHSAGKGVAITPSGLNINADLDMGSNSLTGTKSIEFDNQDAAPTSIQSLYVAQGSEITANDLWYNDSNGVAIQLTKDGTVNAVIASLPGQSYAAGTFVWKQGDGSTTPANFDIGSIIIRPNTAGTSNGVRIQPPSGISSQYDITLPLLPASAAFMQISSAGVITATPLLNRGITADMIANNAVITRTIAPGNVGYAELADTAVVFNTTAYDSNDTFTVPDRCTQVIARLTGGGGGGGGGGASGASLASAGNGGGGGAAGASQYFVFQVTPGEVLTLVVGGGGAGGAGGATSGANGAAGSAGTITTLTTGAGAVFRALPGGGGAGGAGWTSSSSGATASAGGTIALWSGENSQGGAGGTATAGGGTGGNGIAGFTSPFGDGGAGGAGAADRGGAGGGGGAGTNAGGAGAAGAIGNAAGSAGSQGTGTNSGAGGGGGSGGRNGGGVKAGGDGAAGRSGRIRLYYQS